MESRAAKWGVVVFGVVVLLYVGLSVLTKSSVGGFQVMEDMISKPQQSNVVLEMTIKDGDGKPLSASVDAIYFVPTGWEGAYAKKSARVNGTGRMEFRGIRAIDLEISGYPTHEDFYRSWDFTDLKPGEWRLAPDQKTIIVRQDVVLRPFPWNDRQTERVGAIDDSELVKAVSVEGRVAWQVIDDSQFVPVDGCEAPTLGFAFIEAPDQVAVTDPKNVSRVICPAGRRVVLRVCSPDVEDGVQFSGEFADVIYFGNGTPEAPEGGYSKELLLPNEWSLEGKMGIVYIRLGGLYGKMRVIDSARFPRNREYPITQRPWNQSVVVYNPTGGRSLRTTYRTP